MEEHQHERVIAGVVGPRWWILIKLTRRVGCYEDKLFFIESFELFFDKCGQCPPEYRHVDFGFSDI